MKENRTLLYILICLFIVQSALGQSDYGSENELVKQAGKSFEAGDYFKAAPLYSQLSSLYPKDAIFNYRCGVCFLYTEKDKNKSIAPLTTAIATQNPKLPAGAHYYLGRAYHLTNQLEEAENEYNRFLQNATPKELENSDVNRLIEMSRSARSINPSSQLIDIVDRQTVGKDAFVSGYDLNPFKIKVLSIPENYRSAADKKRNENKNLYLMRGSGIVMFSSISGNDRTDKDLFIIRNFSPDNNANPENPGKNINTPYDEDYPFLSPDGKTLYFSSKGHNSIGGYDLFKSTWNEANQTWNKPENLGTPINSTDDDFFLVMADGVEDGYFATMRESSFDKVTVMKFRIRTKPLLFSSVSASFNQLNAEKENEVRITAYTIDQSRMAGIFAPNRNTHDYNIALRAGSDFIIKVEYPGFKTVYDTLKNPVGDGSSQTVQKEIRIADGQTDDKALALVITAHQITPIEEQQIQKQVEAWKADPANAGREPEAFALNSIEEAQVSTEKETSEQAMNSNKEIIENAEKEGGDLKAEASQLKREATQLHDDANQKQSLAKAKDAQAEDLRKQIEATTDPALKATFASRVDKLTSDAELLNKEAELLTFEAQRKEELATRKSREAEFAANDAKTLQQSASSSAIANEDKTNTNADAPVKTAAAYAAAYNRAEENSKNLKQESDELYQQAEEIKKEAAGITDESEKEKTLTRAFNIELMAKKRQDESKLENERALAFKDSAGGKQESVANQQALALKEEGNRLNAEAKAFNMQAKTLSQQAKATEDPLRKKELSRQAMQLLNQEEEKKKLAEEKYEAARQAEESSTQTATAIASNTQQPANVQAVLDNPRITEVQKQEIVALLVESNTKQAQATEKQAEAKSTAAASRNTLDAEEKKNLSRKAIQLMNESSSLTAEAEEKAQQASALQNRYESQTAAVASAPSQTETNSASNAYIAQADATKVVMEKQNENENGNGNGKENQVKDSNVAEVVVAENKAADLADTPKPETVINNEAIGQEKTTAELSSTNTLNESSVKMDPEAARAEAMTLRAESEELKLSAKNLKYEANNSESEKEKADKLKEAMTLLQQSDSKAQRADSLLLVAGIAKSEDNATATLTPENKQRVDEVTASAAEKQKQAEQLEAEARAKNKSSDTLSDEEQRQREKLAALALVESAEAQKAEAQQEAEKAARLEQELKERERRDREIYAEAEIREAKKDSGALADQTSAEAASNQQAERLEAEAAQLKQEASSLNTQADEVQKTARRMANPADKSKFMKQSDQLRLTAESKQKEAENKLAEAQALRSTTSTLAANTATENKQSDPTEAENKASTAAAGNSDAVVASTAVLKSETERLYAEAVATENEARNLEAQAEEQKQIANTAKKKKARKTAAAEAVRLGNLASLKKEEANSKFAEVEKLSAAALAKNTDEAKATEKKAGMVAPADSTIAFTESTQSTSSESLTAGKEVVNNSADSNQEPIANASDQQGNKELASNAPTSNEAKESSNAADTKAAETALKSESKEQAVIAETKTAEAIIAEENKVVAQAEMTESKTNDPSRTQETVVAQNTNTLNISPEQQSTSANTNTAIETNAAVKTAETNAQIATSTQQTQVVATPKKISINRNASTSVYGPSNPIPVNPTLSSGLIFKIQIGAFRNPVPAEIFKGMEPLIGETTASGLTRYLAGDFGAFEPANWAKNEVRALGYKDAFVVAYNNGKRISIPEARAIIAAMQPSEKSKYEQLAQEEMLALKENNIYPEKYNNPAEVALVQSFNQPGTVDIAASNTAAASNTTAAQSGETSTASQTQPTETQGTRYTVQVGVYRNPAVPASLQSIANLNSELTPSGLTRFTSGVFASPAEADAARRAISPIVKDAFVIVYKGNAAATPSTSNATSAAVATSTKKRNNRQEQAQQNTNNTTREQATAAVPAAKKQGLPDDGKVVYRIQVGSFTSQVPFDVIQKFLSIRNLGIVNQINDSGLNLFYTGACTDMGRAEYMLNQAKAAGLNEATIVALKGRTPISMDEAKSALGK